MWKNKTVCKIPKTKQRRWEKKGTHLSGTEREWAKANLKYHYNSQCNFTTRHVLFSRCVCVSQSNKMIPTVYWRPLNFLWKYVFFFFCYFWIAEKPQPNHQAIFFRWFDSEYSRSNAGKKSTRSNLYKMWQNECEKERKSEQEIQQTKAR